MKYAAFFDLDHTLISINSGEALLHRAYRNGVLSTRNLIHAYILALLYKAHILDPLTLIERFGGWLAQSKVSDIENLCRELVEKELTPALRPQMIREIKFHREQGAEVVMLSSAIYPVANLLSAYLEMHAVICSELEVLDQRYTGRPVGRFCFREEKLIRMKQYLQRNQYTLENSYYYADSMDDLPVLQSVGHPVCVHPDRGLKKTARDHHWPVLAGK